MPTKKDAETSTTPERKKLRSKWLEPNQDQARRSNKTERRLAQRLGGKRLARSGGALWSRNDKSATSSGIITDNGDLGTKDFHLESKRTVKDSLSLQKDWLKKVSEGARRVFKDPGVVITFDNGDRKPPEDWVLVPMEVFEKLRKLANSAS